MASTPQSPHAVHASVSSTSLGGSLRGQSLGGRWCVRASTHIDAPRGRVLCCMPACALLHAGVCSAASHTYLSPFSRRGGGHRGSLRATRRFTASSSDLRCDVIVKSPAARTCHLALDGPTCRTIAVPCHGQAVALDYKKSFFLFFSLPCRPHCGLRKVRDRLRKMKKKMEMAIEQLLSRVMIQTSGACCRARLRAQMRLALTPVARAVGACLVAQGLASS